jgi:poly(A) polymerase
MIWKLFSRSPKLPFRYKSQIDSQALEIVSKLQAAGFRSYLVGGCVRDLLLSIPPKDFDIATAANPFKVKTLIPRSQIIGKRFKIVLARRKNSLHQTKQMLFPPLDRFRHFVDFQITTFRRAPEKSLSGTLNENVYGSEKDDAERRDFTFNGLFLDPSKDKIVDYVGGLKDIQLKEIRTIGDPWHRFEEDPIRMLRAIRFAVKLKFQLEKNTSKALKQKASCLMTAKKERTREEFLKMAREGYLYEYIDELHKHGLLKFISLALKKSWETPGGQLRKQVQALDALVKKNPWPNNLLSAPFFFGLLYTYENKRFFINPNLATLKEDFLISKAEFMNIEGALKVFNRLSRHSKGKQSLAFMCKKNIETQAQFFFILKLLAETHKNPFQDLWRHNENLWKESKSKHFSKRTF